MIEFKDVSIGFSNRNSNVVVAKDFSLTLKRHDFTCILGPSGCGKTSLLNIIAGFEYQQKGGVLIDDVRVRDTNTRVSYVFQGHNLFPWKTVRQNILFGLISDDMTTIEKNKQTEAIANDVGLSDYLDNYPESISGGMKQRVGIARALVSHPEIILMDEPFASLDALTAHKTRRFLKELCRQRPTTVVFVTHNIDEALELGDRIIVVSRSPMQILIDQRDVSSKKETARVSLKREVYNSLEGSIDE